VYVLETVLFRKNTTFNCSRLFSHTTVRTGKLASDTSGHETVTLTAGNTITLHTDASYKESSTETDLYVDYAGLSLAISAGSKVLLDDGAIILTAVSSNENSVTCKIENTGDLRSRAGVNLPYADTSDLPAMSDKDKADIKYGMSRDVDIDFVAASFVQTADGVREIRAHIEACARELGWSDDQPLPLIISKIETAGALMHFDEILAESDAIMVARGDLGVEIPLQQVTNAQKEMVAACNAAGKPVIVATQMLESMTKNPRPTRAEVSGKKNVCIIEALGSRRVA
jgi:pyruvate kinase